MKRFTLIFAALMSAVSFAFAGGMVHNTNQSAAWIRMLVRDASTDVDAAFFNPAGLTQLEDGFHFQLNSQTIGQTRTVTSDYSALNNGTFEGTTSVPFLPTFFAAYKTGKMAVSAGFTVIGGGGSANFEKGLPSFETPIAAIPSLLAAQGIPTDAYSADIAFEGTSSYFGYQMNFSYAINDMISVALGGRYVSANNSYVGGIKNIMINPNYPAAGANGSMMSAPDFFTNLAAAATAGAQGALNGYTTMQPLIDGGASSLTLDQALAATIIDATQYATIIGGLQQLGVTTADGTMTIGTAYGTFQTLETSYTASAATATANAAATQDQAVDVKQTGSTFTPIFGVDLNLMDGKLNVGMKYEMASKMIVTNETTTDDPGMFPDGEEVNANLPAFFSLGLNYKLADNFSVQAGTHYYWDMNVSYGKSLDGVQNVSNDLVLNSNAYELAGGLEYGLSDKFLLSAGYLFTYAAPRLEYQSDLSYSLATNSVGFGGKYNVADNFGIDFGFLNTFYTPKDVNIGGITTTYDKSAWVFSLGLTYSLLK